MRTIIQAATNKGKSFNHLVQWLAFGGDHLIATNDRAAQRKIITYNHLVANGTIFSNVVVMSQVLQALHIEGQTIDPDAIAALSPSITEHIDRCGRYSLEEGQPPPLDESIFSTAWLPETDRNALAVERPRSVDHEGAAESVQVSFDGWQELSRMSMTV